MIYLWIKKMQMRELRADFIRDVSLSVINLKSQGINRLMFIILKEICPEMTPVHFILQNYGIHLVL